MRMRWLGATEGLLPGVEQPGHMITRLASAPSSETPCRLGSSAYFR